MRRKRIVSLPQELWSFGRGVETRRRHRRMKLWSFGGAMQALPQKRHGDRVLLRRAARVGTWMRHRGSERWRYAAAVEKQEIWSSGGTLQALPLCLKSSSVLLLEFVAFVRQGSRRSACGL